MKQLWPGDYLGKLDELFPDFSVGIFVDLRREFKQTDEDEEKTWGKIRNSELVREGDDNIDKHTLVRINQESGQEYCAIQLFCHSTLLLFGSFAQTAHLIVCYTLLSLLACFVVPIYLLTVSRICEKVAVLNHSAMSFLVACTRLSKSSMQMCKYVSVQMCHRRA